MTHSVAGQGGPLPSVSVVIPTFNTAAYVRRAVLSALAQEDVSVEVIVVDDCSTDDTSEVLRAIDDPRLVALVTPRNGGPGAARNLGLDAASGDWIAILDADDTMTDDRLRTMIAFATASGAQVVVDNQCVRYESGEPSHSMFPEAAFDSLKRLDLSTLMAGALQGDRGGYPLAFVKPIFAKSAQQRASVRYPEDLSIGEDYIFLARLLVSGAACAVMPKHGYQYTVRRTSISHRMSVAQMDAMLDHDVRFAARHALSPGEKTSLSQRTRGMRRLRDYLQFRDALVARDPWKAAGQIARAPWIVGRLWKPIRKRIFRRRP